jgi:hypothetical protein
MANAHSPQTSNRSTNQSTNTNKSSSCSNNNKNRNKGNNSNSKGSANTLTLQHNALNLSSKLGKDGKLTPEKSQWRFNQGLCMLCGTKGHIVKDCPKGLNKSNSLGSKGRSAKTLDMKAEATMASTSEPKK